MIRDLLATVPVNGWTLTAAVLLAALAGFFIGCSLPGRRT